MIICNICFIIIRVTINTFAFLWIKQFCIKTIFFFLLGEYSTFDKNISPGNTNYKLLIKNIADYAEVGIHPSYFSMKNDLKIKKEKEILEGIVNFPIRRSRQHYLRIELPETYQNLVDLEIHEEYWKIIFRILLQI